MYVADHPSRAYLRQTEDPPKDEFQVFALELEEINPLDTVKITSERLSQLQKATEQDPVMQALKNTFLIGWPDTKKTSSSNSPRLLEFPRRIDTAQWSSL